MIAKLQRFFQQALADPDASSGSEPTLELATAALLCEVVRADYQYDEREMQLLRAQLKWRFALTEDALDELMELAREEADSAVDHYQFVSLIKEHYAYEQRCELVRLMWMLALADGEHHPLEEHRIRRLSDLLHISHSDFIRTKLQARDSQAGDS